MFAKFRKGTMKKYADMMDGFEARQLKKLAESVTRRVGDLAEGVCVDLAWSDTHLQIDVPHTRALLVEGGMPFEVKRVGHGSQRAFIIAMLQEIAASTHASAGAGIRRPPSSPGASPCDRRARALPTPDPPAAHGKSARGSSPGRRRPAHTGTIHIALASLFGMDRIENIRLIKKQQAGAEELTTIVRRTRLADVKNTLSKGDGTGAPPDASLADRLRVTMTPWLNEGFFASLVVLVEGDNDYAAILGAARSLGINFEKAGVSVIPCNGKNNMDKPLAVFASIGIKTYVVWDTDRGHENKEATESNDWANKLDNTKRMNKKLLAMLDLPQADWPSGVHEKYTCFEDNLNTTVRSEIGESLYSRLREGAKKKFDIDDGKNAEKKSLVMVEILKRRATRTVRATP